MTIPYLPGWWDEINRGGAAEKFVGALDKRLRPDAYAQQALQQMVQQNPAVLEQISNMDEGQRLMFAQSMGFQKGNPFEDLAPGFERQEREDKRRAVASITNPVQLEERNANLAGVTPQRKIAIEDEAVIQRRQAFEQDLASGKLELDLLTGKVKDMNRIQKMIDEGLAKFGSVEGMPIRALVRDFVRSGKEIDPLQAFVIRQNPGAAALFDMAYKVELERASNEARINLARLKDPNEQQNALRLMVELGNQYEAAESRLVAQMGMEQSNPLTMMQPFSGAAQLSAIRKQREQLSTAVQDLLKKINPNLFQQDSTTAPPPAAPTIDAASVLQNWRNRNKR